MNENKLQHKGDERSNDDGFVTIVLLFKRFIKNVLRKEIF